MKLEKFYRDVCDVFLFPGSLDELNSGYNEIYEVLPLESQSLYVSGIVIPTQEDIVRHDRALFALSMRRSFIDDEEDVDLGLETFLQQMLYEYYENEEFQKYDIRYRAQEVGAQGIIRLQYESTSNVANQYDEGDIFSFQKMMGVPVRLVS